jgi:class 3 adenylate cyclase/pimeloyl-ACP methyl ester carboxylesterase
MLCHGNLAALGLVGEDRGVDAEIRYARNGGVAIAYQVVGEGDVDLVLVPDFMSNLVFWWLSPLWRGFYERLARSFRLILFDKRGTGLSDHGPQYATLETRMEDMRAVLDAVGSSSAVIFGSHEGTLMATLYAASYPERTRALVLFHPTVAGPGTESREVQKILSELRERWGTRELSDEIAETASPSLYPDEAYRRWLADALRVGASPTAAYALNRAYFESDLSEVLPAVRVPTLVLYRQGRPGDVAVQEFWRPQDESALDVAARIPGATAMRLSGSDWSEIFLSPEAADEIERFVAGEQPAAVPESVLTTLMFTDLVGSTERAAALGDRGWRELLAAHHAVVRRELGHFRGEERDTAGDGFFATFDGPARAIRAAHSIIVGLEGLDLQARVGIHVGECELHDRKPTGVAVNIGARVASLADPGEVLVTRTVRDLVAGSGLQFAERGRHRLKGVPGDWELFTVSADTTTP